MTVSTKATLTRISHLFPKVPLPVLTPKCSCGVFHSPMDLSTYSCPTEKTGELGSSIPMTVTETQMFWSF